MSPPLRHAALAAYCLVIFLVLDFGYSNLFKDDSRPLRIPDPVYHHGLAANFDGFDIWGENRHKLYTNSLGFKDAAVRDVPAKAATRRVLLMGDSFTEGIGLAFEDTFAGKLYRAGQARAEKIEFLNAGVSGYSPVIYYKKIKYLLEQGLRFDEVIVFADMTDVKEEATVYFCIDDDPKYRASCNPADTFAAARRAGPGVYLQKRFIVTDTLRLMIKHKIATLLGSARNDMLAHSPFTGWAIPGYDPRSDFAPLGIEGGVARSLKNMGALADLLEHNRIPLTIVVHPHPAQLAHEDRDSRQVALWRDFCVGRCKAFINLFPAFFAARDAHADWYERLFIVGDFHYSAGGNELYFRELAKHLL
jgi:hypothetical protein